MDLICRDRLFLSEEIEQESMGGEGGSLTSSRAAGHRTGDKWPGSGVAPRRIYDTEAAQESEFSYLP